MRSLIRSLFTLVLIPALAACATTRLPPIQPVAHVDLPRFMGCWYVIAAIPPGFEKNTYDSRECYRLEQDGHRVATRFSYRDGGFEGPAKTVHSTGFVRDGSGNAVWGVQFIWPFRAQYIVAYLDKDYQTTIIARDARDYAWVMARTPTLPQARYDALVAHLKTMGYSLKNLRKVPQRWLAPSSQSER